MNVRACGVQRTHEDGALNRFYSETAFLPFAACLDGRQDLAAALGEVPRLALPIARRRGRSRVGHAAVMGRG